MTDHIIPDCECLIDFYNTAFIKFFSMSLVFILHQKIGPSKDHYCGILWFLRTDFLVK